MKFLDSDLYVEKYGYLIGPHWQQWPIPKLKSPVFRDTENGEKLRNSGKTQNSRKTQFFMKKESQDGKYSTKGIKTKQKPIKQNSVCA